MTIPTGRLNSGNCLMCGDVLIMDENDEPISGPYQCCSECTKKIERERYQLKKRKERGKIKTKTVITSDKVMRQIRPSGKMVEGAVVFDEPSKIRPR